MAHWTIVIYSTYMNIYNSVLNCFTHKNKILRSKPNKEGEILRQENLKTMWKDIERWELEEKNFIIMIIICKAIYIEHNSYQTTNETCKGTDK